MVKRVLYVTPWSPGRDSGGGIHCLANAKALLDAGYALHYIGPPISERAERILTEEGRFVREHIEAFGVTTRCAALLSGAASSLVVPFIRWYLKKGHVEDYDLVVVETSRCDFVLRYSFGCPTVVVSHNVASHYVRQNNKGIWGGLKARRVGHSERRSIEQATEVWVVHDRDRRLYENVYPRVAGVGVFREHNVCAPDTSAGRIDIKARKREVLFPASLDTEVNARAIARFVETIWRNIDKKGFVLRVAGRNPVERVMELGERFNDIVVDANPSNMGRLLGSARIVVVPDSTGTGMKVKVAKAMSYGTPILSTREGLYGYRKAGRYAAEARNRNGLAAGLECLLGSDRTLRRMSRCSYRVWRRNYSYKVFQRRVERYTKRLINK